jgi:hypothetical protein
VRVGVYDQALRSLIGCVSIQLGCSERDFINFAQYSFPQPGQGVRHFGSQTNQQELIYATLYRSIYSDALKTEQVQSGESLDIVSERITYQFPNALPGGSKAELKIGFSGELTGSMMGYYKSSWEDEGKKKHYALTQFEVSLGIHTSGVTYLIKYLQSPPLRDVHSLAGTSPYSRLHLP